MTLIPDLETAYVGSNLADSLLDSDDREWHPFTPYSNEILLKQLHIDYARGQTIFLMKAPAGSALGRHVHYGSVYVYTAAGSWQYPEHGWVATAGDFVLEAANSTHTFVANPGEDVLLFIILEGALEFFAEDGSSLPLETSKTFAARYEAHCAKHGIKPRDLTEFGH